MESSKISFIIRATYDVLPSPKNLHEWYGENPICVLCPTKTYFDWLQDHPYTWPLHLEAQPGPQEYQLLRTNYITAFI